MLAKMKEAQPNHVSDTYLHTKWFFFFISRMECVLSAAVELWKAAIVNQSQSWVFQELNLFFLFLEAKSPSLLRILKKSSSSNTRQIEADNNTKREIWNLHKKRTNPEIQ